MRLNNGSAQQANKVAKQLVIAPHRAGGQVPFIEQTFPTQPSSNRLTSLLAWLQSHLAHHHTTDQLAKRTAMSCRSFTRHFKQLTGYSLTQWLIEQRLSQAQTLLETSYFSLEQIAQQVGFSSSSALRQHFLKKFKLTPSQYQKNFHHP